MLFRKDPHFVFVVKNKYKMKKKVSNFYNRSQLSQQPTKSNVSSSISLC